MSQPFFRTSPTPYPIKVLGFTHESRNFRAVADSYLVIRCLFLDCPQSRTVRGLGLDVDPDISRTRPQSRTDNGCGLNATADCSRTRPIRVHVMCAPSPEAWHALIGLRFACVLVPSRWNCTRPHARLSANWLDAVTRKTGLPQNAPRDRTAPRLHSAQVAAPFRQPSFVTLQNWMAASVPHSRLTAPARCG